MLSFSVCPFPQAHRRRAFKVQNLVPARGGELILKRPGARHPFALGSRGLDDALAHDGELLARVRRRVPVREEVSRELDSRGVFSRPRRVRPARGEDVLKKLAKLLGGNLERVHGIRLLHAA